MSGGTSSASARRLKAAGFTTIAAASFLLLAWALFPTAAGANHGSPTPLGSPGNPLGPGDNVGICHHTGAGNFVANHPAVNANNIPAIAGHSSHDDDIVPPFYYDDDNDDNTPGVLSAGVNFSGSNIALWNNGCVAGTTSPPTTSTTPPTTTSEPPTTTSEPPTTTSEPPPTSTSVQPTTITPPDETTPPDDGTTVSPTSVTPPGGTAFTGIENVIPLGVIAIGLMTAGSGLLWAGARRGRKDEEE